MKKIPKWILGLILLQLFSFSSTFGDEPLYQDANGQYHYNFDDGDETYPYWKISSPSFLNNKSFSNKHYIGCFKIIKKVPNKRAFIIQANDTDGGGDLFYLLIPKTWKMAKSYTQTEKHSSLPRFNNSNNEYLMVYVTNDYSKFTGENGLVRNIKILDLCFVSVHSCQ